jgi:multidrug resistance efflux pump
MRTWTGRVLILIAAAAALGCSNGGNGLKLPGVVEVQEVRLGSKIGGRVAEVLVQEGQIAEPGQVLVRFEAPELEAQKAQLEARVKAAQAQWDRARVGSRSDEIAAAEEAWKATAAKAKRLQEGWRAEEKSMAENELVTTEAELANARDRLQRVQAARASNRGAVTPEEEEAALTARNAALGRRDAALAKAQMYRTGSRPEDIAEAVALAAQAEANYRLVKEGPRAEDKAAAEAALWEAQGKLREVEAQLAEAVVKAPERAVIEVLAVRKGDLVPPNTPILRVLRAADLWVKVYVPEPDLGKLRLGQAAEITLDAYPEHRFAGKVIQIASESEFTPRNVQSANERKHQVFGVKVQVDDPKGVFKAGLAAEATFALAGPAE